MNVPKAHALWYVDRALALRVCNALYVFLTMIPILTTAEHQEKRG